MNEADPDAKSLLNYSMIALPLSFAGLPLYIHMPDFYTRQFGISIGLIGGVLLVIRLIDALQDPLIGYISDKTGNRRPTVIYAGCIILTLGMAGLLFGCPYPALSTTWFALFMILATTGFSILTININMLGGFWKENSHQRVRISSWRESFGLLGLLIAALLPTLLQNWFSDRFSYSIMFVVFVFLMIPAFILFRIFLKSFQVEYRVLPVSQPSSFALFSALARDNRLFFLICFLSYLAASIPSVLVLFFIRDYLAAETLSGAFLALYFISGVIFMGSWVKLSVRFGSYTAWIFSMILSICAFVGAVFLSPGDLSAYAVICILSGIALGADLALPPALIAGRLYTNDQKNQATQYYAVLSFLPKVAMAFAAGFCFLVLDQIGFQAGRHNSETALNTLLVVYAIAPCVLKALSAGLLWRLIRKEGHDNETFERIIHHGTRRIS